MMIRSLHQKIPHGYDSLYRITMVNGVKNIILQVHIMALLRVEVSCFILFYHIITLNERSASR